MKRKIIILLLTFVACFCSRQTQAQQTLELNSSTQGSGDYFARDKVTLSIPFHTNAVNYSSNVFHAYLDENVVIPLIYNDTPQIIDDSYSLNTSLPVGTTQAYLDVGNDGSANFVVPIELPPGTAGLQPDISVSYNSNAGSGVMGMGWNISGMSAIYRIPKTMDPNGFTQGVQFDNQDAFALDGNPLVELSPGVFRTSLETFSRVTVLASNANGPVAFQVETKGGLIIEYGVTDDSRLVHSLDNTKVIASYINKVSDRNGNYYTYTYFNNPTSGEFRIDRIEYTANDQANIQLYNKVKFVYEQKATKDICDKYFLGSLQADNVLLKEIRITCEGTLFHKYVFNYSTDVNGNQPDFVFLTDIEEIGSDNSSFNKIVFNWGQSASLSPGDLTCGDQNEVWDQSENAFPGTFKPIPFYGDFDGDGEIEIATINRGCRPNDGLAVWNNSDNNCSGDDIWWDYQVCIQNSGGPGGTICSDFFLQGVSDDYPAQYLVNPSNFYTLGTPDLNGDGKDDAVFCSDRVLQGGVFRSISFYPLISTDNGNGDRYFQPLPPLVFNNVAEDAHVSNDLADYDGDGITDMLVKINSYVGIYYSNPPDQSNIAKSFEDQRTITDGNTSVSASDIVTLDHNGDRLLDMMMYCSYSPGSQGNSGAYIFYGTKDRGVFIQATQPVQSSLMSENKYPGDFNNDGNTDIFAPATQQILFSTGANGQFVPVSIVLPNYTDPLPSDLYSNFYIGDFNGDQRTDIAFYYYKDPPVQGWRYGYFGFCFNQNLSTGEYTYSEIQNGCYRDVSSSEYRKLWFAFPIDWEGDGMTNLLFKRLYWNGTPGTPETWTSGILRGSNQFLTKLCKTVNGLGEKTIIDYNICEMGVMPEACSYPVTTRFFPLQVVNAVQSSTGVDDQMITSNYNFFSPLTHLRGKGFLGFKTLVEYTPIFSRWVGGDELPTLAKTKSVFDFNNLHFYPNLTSTRVSYLVKTCPNDCYNEYLISQSNYTTRFFEFADAPNSSHFWPYTGQKEVIEHYYETVDVSQHGNGVYSCTPNGTFISTSTSYSYPEDQGNASFGNVTTVTVSNGLTQSVTTLTDYVQAGSWCPNAPRGKSVTVTRDQQPSCVSNSQYEYDLNNGLLLQSIEPPGMGDPNASLPANNQSITTDYTYYPTGNLHTSIVSGNDVPSPSLISLEYDSRFRFVTKESNSFGHSTEAVYEPTYGNIIYSKDPNGLVTTYKYDGFGGLKETTSPTGIKTKIDIEWVQGAEEGYNRLYLVKTTVDGINPSYAYYDMLGRSVGSKVTAFANKTVTSTTYYDKFGNVVQSRQPGPNDNRVVTAISYDALARAETGSSYITSQLTDPVTLTSPGSTAVSTVTRSFDFSNDFTSILTDNQSRSTRSKYDKSGTLVSSVDQMQAEVQYTYNSLNQPLTVTAAGAVTTIEYDRYGRQVLLTDPDAGTSTFEYNSFSQLLSQTDNRGNEYEFIYDALGRLRRKTETAAGSSTPVAYRYFYDTEPNGIGLISYINGGAGNMLTTYKYDDFSRNIRVSETFDGQSFTTDFVYDNYNRPKTVTYPSGYLVNYVYDNPSSTLIQLTDAAQNKIWELAEINNTGGVKRSNLGADNHFSREQTFTDLQSPDVYKFNVTFGADTWENKWDYLFDEVTGNMTSRQNVITVNSTGNFSGMVPRDLTELFSYDHNDRLLGSDPASPLATGFDVSYDLNGNILTKTDALGLIQDYAYGSAPSPAHAVQTISPLNETVNACQDITYTPFQKASSIIEGDCPQAPDYLYQNYTRLDYLYGLDHQRRKMTETEYLAGNIVSKRVKYYSTAYEKEKLETVGVISERELTYITAPDGLAAVYEKKNGTGKLYFACLDGQGSINMLVDADNGNLVADLAYDAWGRPRNPNDWTYNNITFTDLTDRGYTGHEMLNAFGLINMNGRCYDPFVGQFLSPDPFVQNTTDPQSYNRFSYCLNNPLKYVDPSGYFNIGILNPILPYGSYHPQAGDEMGFYGWFIRQNLWSAGTWFDSRSAFGSEFSREQASAYNRLRTYTGWKEKDEILNYQGGGLFGKGGYFGNVPMFESTSNFHFNIPIKKQDINDFKNAYSNFLMQYGLQGYNRVTVYKSSPWDNTEGYTQARGRNQGFVNIMDINQMYYKCKTFKSTTNWTTNQVQSWLQDKKGFENKFFHEAIHVWDIAKGVDYYFQMHYPKQRFANYTGPTITKIYENIFEVRAYGMEYLEYNTGGIQFKTALDNVFTLTNSIIPIKEIFVHPTMITVPW